MTTPGWYALVLLSLAAYRSYRLAAFDTVLDRPRARLPQRWLTFVECQWCLGFWVALGWWVGYELTPQWTLIAATPLALAAIAALLWALPA